MKDMAEIERVVAVELGEIEVRCSQGESGYRFVHDRAMRVLIALENAGYTVTKRKAQRGKA